MVVVAAGEEIVLDLTAEYLNNVVAGAEINAVAPHKACMDGNHVHSGAKVHAVLDLAVEHLNRVVARAQIDGAAPDETSRIANKSVVSSA